MTKGVKDIATALKKKTPLKTKYIRANSFEESVLILLISSISVKISDAL